jgi:hypothetical protein
MITKEYLSHLYETFPVLSTNVRLVKSAEKSARKSRESGLRPHPNPENYSNVYRWRTRSHPDIQRWAGWYESGVKVWPENIELTPRVLKHWYCCDGHKRKREEYIVIGMANESGNTKKVTHLFEESGLPTPRYEKYTKDGSEVCSACFTVEQSKVLWEYMGEPLPGFEYKWPG